MRYAIISDIHANRQALQCVLTDIRSQEVDEIICLGDVVGYGPCPAEVLEKAYSEIHHFIMGNHDAVIAGKMSSKFFNDSARQMIDWTASRLDRKAVDFFGGNPLVMKGYDVRFSHGDLVNPGKFGYIIDNQDAKLAFDHCSEQLFFIGHSHVPAIFVIGESGEAHCLKPQDFSLENEKRYIVNVGSVGQPRDRDFRSSYCLFDTDNKDILFRKIPFDIDAYKEDLRRNGLPESTSGFLSLADEKGSRPIRELIDFSPPEQEEFVKTDNEVVDLEKTVSTMRKAIAALLLLFAIACVSCVILGMGYVNHASENTIDFPAGNRETIPHPQIGKEVLQMPSRTGKISDKFLLENWWVNVTDPLTQFIAVENDKNNILFRCKSTIAEDLILTSRMVDVRKGDRLRASASCKKINLSPEDIVYFIIRYQPEEGNWMDLDCKTFADNKNFRSGKWAPISFTLENGIPRNGKVCLSVKTQSCGEFLIKRLSLKRVE